MQLRQGDVLLIRVDEIPDSATPVARDGGAVVLAYGEVTGHRHAVHERHAELLELPDAEVEQRFLRIAGREARLVHEEHDPIALAPGCYRVVRQREYHPLDDPRLAAMRYVAD
jgi:hypothetical protein